MSEITMDEDLATATGHDRRSRVLQAVSRTLAEQRQAVVELQAVIEQCGISPSEVRVEFPNLDDLLVALAAHQAQALCAILREAKVQERVDLKTTLTKFGLAVVQAYSSVLIGFCRVAMTEGSRHRAVRQRVYDQGPGAVAVALTEFLDRAKTDGKIAVDDCRLAAEHLVGLLREPLYRELTLHSQEISMGEGAPTYVSDVVQLFLKGCGNKAAVKP